MRFNAPGLVTAADRPRLTVPHPLRPGRDPGRWVRPRFAALAALAFVAGAGGCVDADTELAVNRDGSGGVRLRFLVRDDARDRVAKLAWLSNRLGLSTDHPLGALLETIHAAGGDPLAAFYRRDVLEEWGRQMGPDVALTQVRRIRRPPHENGFETHYVFPDIRNVSWTSVPVDDSPPDRLTFGFQPGEPPLLTIRPHPGRALAEDERHQRAGSVLARLGAWAGGGRVAAEGLSGLRIRSTVRTEGTARAPRAAFRLDESRILLADIIGDAMSGDDLLRLLRVKDLADLEEMALRPTRGLRLQDPRRPLALLMNAD